MNILIADDDRLVRFTLKSMLLDIMPNEPNIQEARNGKLLVDICTEYQPDIVFVDIQMPFMDGLSAIELCKQNSPNTVFIVLTGHSDFDFARRSIALGVIDYILKPIDPEQLKNVLEKANNHLSSSLNNKNSIFCTTLMDYFSLWEEGIDFGGSFPLPFENAESYYLGMELYLDCINKKYPKLLHTLIQYLQTKIFQELKHDVLCGRLISIEGCIRIVFYGNKSKFPFIINKISCLCDYFSNNTQIVSSIYVKSPDAWTLFCNLKQIHENQWHHIQSLGTCVEFKQQCQPIYKLIYDCGIASQSMDEFMLQKSIQNLSISKTKIPDNCINFIQVVTGEIFDVSTTNQLAHKLKSFPIYNSKPENNQSKIDNILMYIEQNYKNDISITQIAEKYNLTPNYLSSLFHESTGLRFVDYLSQIRISYAKQLLINNTSIKIKDVALMVGYSSARHFSSVFKKITGIYPTDFKSNTTN